MRRLNNLVTLFSAMFAFFFGCFLSTTLTNIDKCATGKSSRLSDTDDGIFLLILILTAPSYFDRRDMVRDTWLQLGAVLTHEYFPEDLVYLPEYDEQGFMKLENAADQEHRLQSFKDWMTNVNDNDGENRRVIHMKHLFVVGTKGIGETLKQELERENRVNKDILFLRDLNDSYANLTQKLIMTISRVVTDYHFNYILKTDDDTYVKLDYLLNELVSYDRKLIRKSSEYRSQPLPELYWGFFHGRAQIKTRGQWKETNFNLCNRYLPYALGGGYVFSRGLAEYIQTNSKWLSMFVSEDISFGTWVASLRNVYKRHDVRFDTGYMPRKCRAYHLVLHKRSPEQMRDLFEDKLCTFESSNEKAIKRPAEYYYDWRKPAEKCCDILVS